MEHPLSTEPSEVPSADERNMALIAHLGTFSSVLIGPLSFLVPLLIYQYWKDRSVFVAEEAKEALNFQLTLLVLTVTGFLLLVVLIGIAVLVVAGVMGIVLPILAAIRAGEGKPYRYPLTIRMVP
jgi:uncharacterized protein